MDPALLREREAFQRRAMATPTVEAKARKEFAVPKDEPRKKVRPPQPPRDPSSYKSMSESSLYRFGVLTKIVKHMKTKHQTGDDHPLTLEEIIDETNQLDIDSSVQKWLPEALTNNPKIRVTADGRFLFKPAYKLKDGKTLMRLLKQHDLKGLGGILLEDVEESLPLCEKILKMRANEIIYITRPNDKKKIMFYNDKMANFSVDDDFTKLWRSVTVDAMDDAKIDDYLQKQGIRSMQDHGIKKPVAPKRKKAQQKKRQFKRPRDNEHLAEVLETYDNNTITKKGDAMSNV